MKRLLLPLFCGLLINGAWAAENRPCQTPQDAVKRGTLRPFADEAELQDLLKCLQDQARKRQAEQKARSKAYSAETATLGAGMMAQAPMALPSAPAPAAAAKVAEAAPGAAADSVTNVQTAGVDEGGIVKVHGKHLVILRRGRLFTVDTERGLRPVAQLDAFAPDAEPRGAWYDEMLIAGNSIIVIGYSYARGGTEIGLFEIDGEGRLAYRATYHLRSNDYYSSRNYASRLIGHKLIFYTPLHLNWYRSDLDAAFPAVRRWHRGATPAEFKRIAPATRIYRTDEPIETEQGLTLHTVNICDLSQAEMRCEATAVLGPAGRVFYVSAESVYVWTTQRNPDPKGGAAVSSVFRIPLDGAAPSGIKTRGAPIDQFSFLESGDGHLNVLLRSQGRGDAMWEGEVAEGETALLRLPLSRFGDGREVAPREAYRRLPHPAGYTLQNRFIGKHVLYGAGSSWGRPQGVKRNLYLTRWDVPHDAVLALPLDHGVDRIEAMGGNAVAVGTQGNDLLFTSVALSGEVGIASVYTRKDAAQGETRSHGFFYKPTGDAEGLIGLPIAGGGRAGYKQLREASAAVLFLKNKALKWSELGTLDAQPGVGANDQCRASCVDWYGNSRPLFLGQRIVALMGYELVEGRLDNGRIEELRRVSFAPQAVAQIAR